MDEGTHNFTCHWQDFLTIWKNGYCPPSGFHWKCRDHGMFLLQKESIEKICAQFNQSLTKISELNAKVREQKEGLSAAEKEMSKVQEEKAQLARDLKEVNETNDDALNINALPNEMILEIFGYLTQNQLGQIAKVCKRWNVLTQSPVLWRKVNVKFFFPSDESEIIIVKSFINGLPSCVNSITLDFVEYYDRIESLHSESLDFEEICLRLQEKCPNLEELILIHSVFSNSLPVVINICTHFLQHVKNLVFIECIFPDDSPRGEYFGISKIENLVLLFCYLHRSNKPLFSKMPHLKQLHLRGTIVEDSWFLNDTSFLNQLDVLNVGHMDIRPRIFPLIQNHGLNLKELYLCSHLLQDYDINFNDSAFPHLKTICIGYSRVTCEGVVSLIQSCPSLENVYVKKDVAESFAAHPFVVANRCKSGIVKAIDWNHKHNVDYSHA